MYLKEYYETDVSDKHEHVKTIVPKSDGSIIYMEKVRRDLARSIVIKIKH